MNALSDVMRRFMFGLGVLQLHLRRQYQVRQPLGFFPLEALQPGTKGTGKTVMRGTEIESFEVEYIGIIRNAGPSGDLILVRVSGAAIDRSGGIAAGISGSPVYIDDQLVGAIGYGFNMADHRVGLVTPIDDMLQFSTSWPMTVLGRSRRTQPMPMNQRAKVEWPGPVPKVTRPRAVVPIGVILASSAEEAAALAETAPADTLVFAPAREHRFWQRDSPTGLGGFESSLATFRPSCRCKPFAGCSRRGHITTGERVWRAVRRGDISLTSLGTVTHVDGDPVHRIWPPFYKSWQRGVYNQLRLCARRRAGGLHWLTIWHHCSPSARCCKTAEPGSGGA